MRSTLVCIVLACQLVGCALLAPTETESVPYIAQENEAKLLAIENWGLVGRLALHKANDSWVLKVNWLHTEQVDRLKLSSTLGGTLATILHSKGQVVISNSEGTQYLKDAEEIESVLGFDPKIDYLKYWVRGLRVPGLAVKNSLVENTPSVFFEQAGWLIKQQRYRYEKGVWLPNKVTVSESEIKIKLVVDEWLKF